MSDDSANFIGSIPEIYDRAMGPVLFADFADDIADRVAAHAPARMLELAAGTGIVTRRLRDRLPGSRLIATDLNAPMLDVARAKFGPDEQIEFRPADATDLPFADSGFDAVVCQFGVMFFPDKAKSYAEAFRVLARGGRYHLSVWDAPSQNPYGRIAHELVSAFLPADPPQFYRVPFGYHAIEPIRDALGAAGFVDIRATPLSQSREIADVAGFAHGFVYGNPASEQIRARGGDPAAFADRLAEAYRQEFGTNPGRMPLRIIIFEATRP